MMVILKGRVRISTRAINGKEAVLKVAEGEVFGETALLDGKQRTADAVTTSPCELMVVEHDAFLPLLMRRPECVSAC